jgi:hypothetical protein
MMLEVHELSEMLCKVKSGHFRNEVQADMFEQGDFFSQD